LRARQEEEKRRASRCRHLSPSDPGEWAVGLIGVRPPDAPKQPVEGRFE
jgi:hypothetical protein